ncbi:hypothetical protein DdX_09199 [Ditylenchus destructor]|uniref:Uncharacterized protein n=1 Tax=Ditylenchus destructor TaxID=166010 RepID=A0AAD4N501_9BILA|nr:hypothetical protein DdX_09197 [Ditylenchus destructor]KAI1713127.1 hypothetical protein DdX_09199 [Ditylenchus destructor]
MQSEERQTGDVPSQPVIVSTLADRKLQKKESDGELGWRKGEIGRDYGCAGLSLNMTLFMGRRFGNVDGQVRNWCLRISCLFHMNVYGHM